MYKQKKLNINDVENIIDLSSMQQGMLFYYMRDITTRDYHEQLNLTITGDLKVDIFQKALDFVIENNEMLRTVYRWAGMDKPVQIILKSNPVLIKYMDFTHDINKNDKIKEIEVNDIKERIDITKEL